MKLFISHSGDTSRIVALKLKGWIHEVIQAVDPWMSETDIEAGARWSPAIANALAQTRFGIICLTRDNATAPWLLFEAGALAKAIEGSSTFVCPYLIDLDPSDIPSGPLTQFQAKRADLKGTLELMTSVNQALGEEALPKEQLRKTVERWWEELDDTLRALPQKAPQIPERRTEEMLKEILETVRELSRSTVKQQYSDAVAAFLLRKSMRDLHQDASRKLQLDLVSFLRQPDACLSPLDEEIIAVPVSSPSPSPSPSPEDETPET